MLYLYFMVVGLGVDIMNNEKKQLEICRAQCEDDKFYGIVCGMGFVNYEFQRNGAFQGLLNFIELFC